MGALGRPFLLYSNVDNNSDPRLNNGRDYLAIGFSFGKQLMEKPSII